MPTNRRKLGRKHHALAEAEAWETYMMLGTDWFHDLDRAGYSPEDIEREAPGVWHRHGARYIALWQNANPPWGPGHLPYGARRFGYQSNTH